MNEATLNLNTKTAQPPQFLWFITLTYCMVIVFANWYDARLIHFFGLDTDAGTLIFPLSFLLSDLITEVYGYKNSRQVIWTGFLFNLLFIAYGKLIILFDSPAYAVERNQMFDQLLDTNIRIIIASTISYLIAEPFNAYLLAKLKIKAKGKYIGTRFLGSTFFAAGFDSFMFGSIAFYGVMTNPELLKLILGMWFIKVFIEACGLPLSIRLAARLKKWEGLDIYDRSTRFNIFSLDTRYAVEDNQFSKKDTESCSN